MDVDLPHATRGTIYKEVPGNRHLFISYHLITPWWNHARFQRTAGENCRISIENMIDILGSIS